MKKFLLLSIILGFYTHLIAQQSITLNPDKDNSIYSESGSVSNGLGHLYSGLNNNGDSRRALLYFDIASNLPAGVTITNVTLELNMLMSGPSANLETYDLHPLTQDWGEGTSSGTGQGAPAVAPDATWTDAMFGTSTWTSVGGDYGASSASANVGAAVGTYSWSSGTMVSDVQSWLDTPSGNFGWILIGDETVTGSARKFGSKDMGTAPVLTIQYSCATPPTASCQGQVVYLDALGDSTLSAFDYDNGSFSNCGGNLSYSATQTTFNCSDVMSSTIPDGLVISAVYDGPITGGVPKGVELYAYNYIPDLSEYGLGSANNGGGSDGEEFTFPAMEVAAGTYIYVASESIEFQNFFGFAPDFTDGAAIINGDDAIELFKNGSVIDVFGDINTDGTGQAWEYMDGWASRNSSTGPDGSTFNIASWTFSGPNSLDGETSNNTAANPVPIQSYTKASTYGIDVTLTVTDDFNNTNSCVANVVVFDTIAPQANCETDANYVLDATGLLTLTVNDIDSSSVDACGIQNMSISQTTFSCVDQGTVPVTLQVVDNNGNVGSCVADIAIDASQVISITQDSITDPTCFGDTNGAIYVSLSGGDPTPSYIIDWSTDGLGDNDDTEDQTNLGDGTYEITVTDANGCISQETYTLTQAPFIDTSLSFDGTTITSNESGATYQWIDCSDMTAISGETNSSYTPAANGSYMVAVTQGACTDSSACITVDGLFLDDNELSFRIYPNPTTGQLYISLNKGYGEVLMELMDIKGSVLQKKILNGNADIDISEFQNGVYFVKLSNDNTIKTKKIILQR